MSFLWKIIHYHFAWYPHMMKISKRAYRLHLFYLAWLSSNSYLCYEFLAFRGISKNLGADFISRGGDTLCSCLVFDVTCSNSHVEVTNVVMIPKDLNVRWVCASFFMHTHTETRTWQTWLLSLVWALVWTVTFCPDIHNRYPSEELAALLCSVTYFPTYSSMESFIDSIAISPNPSAPFSPWEVLASQADNL